MPGLIGYWEGASLVGVIISLGEFISQTLTRAKLQGVNLQAPF